jgi:hypothetical protein
MTKLQAMSLRYKALSMKKTAIHGLSHKITKAMLGNRELRANPWQNRYAETDRDLAQVLAYVGAVNPR